MPRPRGSFAFWLISPWIRSPVGISAGTELLVRRGVLALAPWRRCWRGGGRSGGTLRDRGVIRCIAGWSGASSRQPQLGWASGHDHRARGSEARTVSSLPSPIFLAWKAAGMRRRRKSNLPRRSLRNPLLNPGAVQRHRGLYSHISKCF